jgi:D-sedoheptulose 7-phosphate isomerase
MTSKYYDAIQENLHESARVKERTAHHCSDAIGRLVQRLVQCYRSGGKAVFLGNGGSAADAQHLAAELVGRCTFERPALPSLALTVNSSVVTAVSNDYAYNYSFARQVEALVQPQDVLVAISTSGQSENALVAVQAAKRRGAYTVAFTGGSGGRLAAAADLEVRVPSRVTARIQEAHIAIGHVVCTLLERELFPDGDGASRDAAATEESALVREVAVGSAVEVKR